jgi:LacI family transcriptional regulator
MKGMVEESPSESFSAANAKKRVRMRDVATRCGVSISTVSLVLSGDARIPEDTARRVLQAVKAMEYRPSVLARSLARRISRTIGVILPEDAFTRNKAFYYEALQGIHAHTQPAGFKMVVEAANRVFLARRYYLRLLKEQSADAMIYLAASLNDTFLTEMEREPYPFILVGSYVDNSGLICARNDDFSGAKMAVEHLVSLGHRNIGHIAGSSEVSHGRDRENGYREAMKAAGVEVQPAWVVQAHFDFDQAEKATKSLLDAGVTAIFCASDVMAYGVMKALRDMGKRVPDEISVVGMDDLEMSGWLNPALTTVRYDIRSMAEAATKYAIKRIQAPTPGKPTFEIPPLELIIRGSSAPKK